MARDEALLESVATGGPPVLRFYAWQPATLSLGYFQAYADFQSQPPEWRCLPVVRRTTGGGAILHDAEVTYALIVSAGDLWLRPNANRLYELAHRAVIAAVGHDARLAGPGHARGASGAGGRGGPFLCFSRRHELDVVVPNADPSCADGKIAGSAQRRRPGAILQHGSIILAPSVPPQPCADWAALDGPIGFESAVMRLRSAFERGLGAACESSHLDPSEAARAAALEVKYASDEWTRRR